MKNIIKLLSAVALTFTLANADVMKKSMVMMNDGMTSIQQGFVHNNLMMIKEGIKMVEEGNNMFSDPKTIAKYLPKEKQHMTNVAANQAKRITLDLNVMGVRLDDKSYVSAANAYSDILNACSRCHAIIRDW